MGKRYKVAFFTTYMEGEDYSEPIWNNINLYCKEYDIDLYMFPGRNIREEFGHHVVFNQILNFIKLEMFDGVIMASSAMMTSLGEAIVKSYVNQLNSLPLVSIGYHFDDVSSVFIDNKKGMELIINHLYEEHKVKRIAYLSGPKVNEESNQRLEATQLMCRKLGIELQEADIFYGYFNPIDIHIILAPLLDERIDEIDALICANDSMASAAIDLLKEHDISIPEDIIVTGFDYSRPAKFQTPTITTISQSLDKIALQSVKQLVGLIEGKEPIQDIHIEPRLIINKSCGCEEIHDGTQDEINLNISKNIFSQYQKSISHLTTRVDHERILSCKSYNDLYKALEYFLVRKGIESYYLFLYNKYSSRDDLEFLFGRKEGINIDRESRDNNFGPNEFIPYDILPSSQRVTLITMPLFSQNQFYGYLIVEAKIPFGVFYEDSQMVISSALSSIVELEDMRQAQKLMVESEKMSFLGNLIAGLAHEINTPVGITLTAASHEKDLLNNLNELYSNEQLSKTKLEHFLEQSGNSLDLMMRSLKTTVKLINRFKLISVQSDVEEMKILDISELFNRIISDLREDPDCHGITFLYSSPEKILISSYEQVYTQIIHTLVINTIQHSFTDNSKREVYIDITLEEGEIIIKYRDSGKGCSENQLQKLFDPFYTTKRHKGQTGLGLSIIYNIIKNRLQGHITAELIEEQLIFTIKIPTKFS